MYVVDALLGNFDRHNGNWGFLFDDETQTAEIAPVFDCGSCLLPQADEKLMKVILENENEMNARIFQFPTSAIKLNDRKINYYNFISSMENEDCNKAILRILPNISLVNINMFIDNILCISEVQKKFYKTYIMERYNKILLPAYNVLKK